MAGYRQTTKLEKYTSVFYNIYTSLRAHGRKQKNCKDKYLKKFQRDETNKSYTELYTEQNTKRLRERVRSMLTKANKMGQDSKTQDATKGEEKTILEYNGQQNVEQRQSPVGHSATLGVISCGQDARHTGNRIQGGTKCVGHNRCSSGMHARPLTSLLRYISVMSFSFI